MASRQINPGGPGAATGDPKDSLQPRSSRNNTHTPDEQPRPLSAAVAEELENAVRAFLVKQSGEYDGSLRRAIASAARDARERQLRPEELLLAFKAVEERVKVASASTLAGDSSVRTRIVQALLDAYYKR